MTKGACIFSFALLASTYSSAATMMLDVSVTPDQRHRSAQFEILFSDSPDFHSVDRFDRQEDAFQFEIDGPAVGKTWPFETLIRGEEIHHGGNIRIRDVEPGVGAPEAGGWGTVRGSVRYSLSDNLLNFEIPFDVLGAPNGVFNYSAFSTHYGAWNGDDFEGSVIALPPAGLFIATGIACLGIFRRHRQKRA